MGFMYRCSHEDCDENEDLFKTPMKVQQHWDQMHRESCKNLFMCQTCGQTFVTECLLQKHIKDRHARKDPIETCTICGKQYTKYIMRDHVLKHTAKRTFKCQVCDYAGLSIKDLRTHRRYSHAEELGLKPPRQHVCSLCGKVFKASGNLREHMTSHKEGQDPKFQCQICSKFLKQANSYGKHMMRFWCEG